MKRYLLTLFFLVMVSGCASVPLGDPNEDAKRKNFSTNPDSAGIYVYRNESFGAAIKMDVFLDGKMVGQTAAKTYFYVEVPAGSHTVMSVSENSDSITLEAENGKLYYIWQEVKMGVLYARTKLHLMNDAEGQAGVQACKLGANSDSFSNK